MQILLEKLRLCPFGAFRPWYLVTLQASCSPAMLCMGEPYGKLRSAVLECCPHAHCLMQLHVCPPLHPCAPGSSHLASFHFLVEEVGRRPRVRSQISRRPLSNRCQLSTNAVGVISCCPSMACDGPWSCFVACTYIRTRHTLPISLNVISDGILQGPTDEQTS